MENNTLCYIWVEKWVNFQKLSKDSVVFGGGGEVPLQIFARKNYAAVDVEPSNPVKRVQTGSEDPHHFWAKLFHVRTFSLT